MEHKCEYRVKDLTHTPEGIRRRKKCIHCKQNTYTLEIPTAAPYRAPKEKKVSKRVPFEIIQQIRAEHAITRKAKPLCKKYGVGLAVLHSWLYQGSRKHK